MQLVKEAPSKLKPWKKNSFFAGFVQNNPKLKHVLIIFN